MTLTRSFFALTHYTYSSVVADKGAGGGGGKDGLPADDIIQYIKFDLLFTCY